MNRKIYLYGIPAIILFALLIRDSDIVPDDRPAEASVDVETPAQPENSIDPDLAHTLQPPIERQRAPTAGALIEANREHPDSAVVAPNQTTENILRPSGVYELEGGEILSAGQIVHRKPGHAAEDDKGSAISRVAPDL